jgi:hypothetical protein
MPATGPDRTYAERQRRAKAVKAWVAEHGWTCPGWGDQDAHPSRDLTADHWTPRRKGGETGPLRILCRTCNGKRGAAVSAELAETHLSGTTINPAEYRRELLAAVAALEDLTARQAADTLRLLDQARKDVLATLASLPAGSRSREMWQRALEGVDDTIGRFSERYAASLSEAVAAGYDLGVDLAARPLTHAIPGLELVAAGAAPYSPALLGQMSPQLVQGMTDDLRRRIHQEVAAVTLGSKPFDEAARAIGRNLTDRNHFSTIAHRARAITMTEVGRAQALGTHYAQQALDRAVRADPTLPFTVRKRWLNAHLPGARQTHLEAEGRYAPGGDPGPIPVDDLFQVAGVDCYGPHDPALPAGESVHCHCVVVTVIPELQDGGHVDTRGISRAAEPTVKPPVPATGPAPTTRAGVPRWYQPGQDAALDRVVALRGQNPLNARTRAGFRLTDDDLLTVVNSPAATAQQRTAARKALAARAPLPAGAPPPARPAPPPAPRPPGVTSYGTGLPADTAAIEQAAADLAATAETWPTANRNAARLALDPASPGAGVVVARDTSGRITGALRYNVEPAQVVVEYVGAYGEQGTGTALMRQAAIRAAAEGKPLTLVSGPESADFYLRLGMRRVEGRQGRLAFDPAETLRFSLGQPVRAAPAAADSELARILARKGDKPFSTVLSKRQGGDYLFSEDELRYVLSSPQATAGQKRGAQGALDARRLRSPRPPTGTGTTPTPTTAAERRAASAARPRSTPPPTTDWKPVMAPQEADAWAAGWEQGSYWHATQFASDIRLGGFQPSRVSMFGPGVYGCETRQGVRSWYGYASRGHSVGVDALRLRWRARRLVEWDDAPGAPDTVAGLVHTIARGNRPAHWTPSHWDKANAAHQWAEQRGLVPLLDDLAAALGRVSSPAEKHQVYLDVMGRHGYDGMRVTFPTTAEGNVAASAGGEQLVIYDPRNVVVVDPFAGATP